MHKSVISVAKNVLFLISGSYFPAFGLNSEIYSVNLCIQSESGKIWTRKNSEYAHILRSVRQTSTKIEAEVILLT